MMAQTPIKKSYSTVFCILLGSQDKASVLWGMKVVRLPSRVEDSEA